MINRIFAARFSDLLSEGKTTLATRTKGASGDYIDHHAFVKWLTKAKQLVSSACGEGSQYFKMFEKLEKPTAMETNYSMMKRLFAAVAGISEDYSSGYFLTAKSLIQAEVFSDELDQAKSLFENGYISAAAVVAGVVLETNLRQLWIEKVANEATIVRQSLNRMNDELASSGAYNSLVQKQVLSIAAIRNSAAHGNHDEYNADDVRNMIAQVESFLINHV
ncbi:hypothetical protein [Asticcacaulis sp.]|uniref:hypothetical protein n=1 Tax=Asticcacaulis sp. TaxID=1872648 RepID=UPI003F7B8C77